MMYIADNQQNTPPNLWRGYMFALEFEPMFIVFLLFLFTNL